MSIKESQAKLFEEWKKKYPFFISDGVFDENIFTKQSLRILFVLKEANWENASLDLCDYLLNGKSPTVWKTWNNVARWTKAWLEGGDYPKYISKFCRCDYLKKVAFLNLKKVGGGATADSAVIRQYAEADKCYIRQQIELYEPDVIICCGRGTGKNADILHDFILNEYVCKAWYTIANGYNGFVVNICGKQVPIISFVHPQMYGGHKRYEAKYNDMLVLKEKLISEIRNIGD